LNYEEKKHGEGEVRNAFNQRGKIKFPALKVLRKFPLVLLEKSTMEAK